MLMIHGPWRHAKKLAPLCTALLVGGCTSAPSVALFGAAFPDWLFCIAGGVVGTVVVHVLLSRRGMASRLAPLAISYPALAAALAMALWLIAFPH